MAINEILKKLEKITDTKEKIAFLMRELKKINDKKIQKQVETILQQIIDQENLEERITLKQPEIQITRKSAQPLEKILPQRRMITKQEEEIEKVDYKIFEGEKNYATGADIDLYISKDPLETNPSKQLMGIDPYKENTDDYQSNQEGVNIHPDRLDESNKDFSTEAILRRKRKEIEYKNGRISQ